MIVFFIRTRTSDDAAKIVVWGVVVGTMLSYATAYLSYRYRGLSDFMNILALSSMAYVFFHSANLSTQ